MYVGIETLTYDHGKYEVTLSGRIELHLETLVMFGSVRDEVDADSARTGASFLLAARVAQLAMLAVRVT